MEVTNSDKNRAKILVVDDEQSIRDMYMYKFSIEGMDVTSASDGKEGVALAKHHKPDVILADLRMPRMDGLEMIQKIRAESWGVDMRIIVLTNISRSEAPRELQFLNISRYIVKAHTVPSQIIQLVRDLLS